VNTNASPAIPTTWAEQTFAPLGNPVFRRIWIAGSVSWIGGMIQSTSAAWLMTSMTDSPLLVALVQTAATLPFVLLAPLAGALADIYDRRMLMLIGNSVCALAVLILGLLTLQGLTTPWVLLALTAVLGGGTIIAMPAWQASVLEIISRDKLTAAISLNSLSFNLARCIGPALGAEIIIIAGVAISFLTNALTYLAMIAALLAWKRPKTISTLPAQSMAQAVTDGFRFAWQSPAISRLIGKGFLFSFCASAVLAMPPLLAVELDAGARGLGFMLGGFGVGAMAGSLMLSWVRTKLSGERIVLFAAIMLSVTIGVLALSNALWLSTLALALSGSAWIPALSTLQVEVQMSCPKWVAGRTISVFSMAFALGIGAGAAMLGWIASISSVSWAVTASCLAMLLVAATSVRMRFAQPSADELQVSPVVESFVMPDIDPRSGPVLVTFEYRVPPENTPAFRQAMQALGRIRRRDGVRTWRLSQNIDDPELWAETFQSPSWRDYIHRTSRRLVADEPYHAAVMACVTGEVVRRRRVSRALQDPDLRAPDLGTWDKTETTPTGPLDWNASLPS